MINFSILLSNSEINGPGGLFDFNATLPLIIIQFIILMIILNIILYNPIVTVIEDRNDFILTSLKEASTTAAKAENLKQQHEQELNKVRKEAQLEIANSQNSYKELLEIELIISKKNIDNLLNTFLNDLKITRSVIFDDLDQNVQSLYIDVKDKLSL